MFELNHDDACVVLECVQLTQRDTFESDDQIKYDRIRNELENFVYMNDERLL